MEDSIRFRQRVYACWAIAVLAPALGCGSDKVTTYPVSVRVTGSNGKPMVGARVAFRSVDERINAQGIADADGRATMTTDSVGEGVVAGRQQAAVRPPVNFGTLDQPRPQSQIPRRFNAYESSQLEFEVVPGGDNNFEIVITDR